MSKVDDELTRRLRVAERPVDGDDLFEGLERRRSHRERVRRVQAGMLAFAVLAGTAGGFIALREIFGESGRGVGKSPVLAENGEIVVARPISNGSEHLFAVQPGQEGERRISPAGQAIYREPSVSPDGRDVAVVHSIPSFQGTFPAGSAVIATIPIEGGQPTWLTEPGVVHHPRWSPDGEAIVFDGRVPGSSDGIHVLDVATGDMRLVIRSSRRFMADAPAWSPHGSRITFVGYDHDAGEQPDLYAIAPDGSRLEQLTHTPDIAERSPDWSPDGSAIAYIASDRANGSDTIRLITPEGDAMNTLFGFEGSVIADVGWSPDGRYLVFLSDLALHDGDQDGDLDVWTVRTTGDEGTLVNYTDEGASGASWQPVPVGSEPEPSPTSEPTVSPSVAPAGRDIGLGFNLCNLRRLSGIDFLGDGTSGTAWTGTKVGSDGTCPTAYDDRYGVAVDFTGDDIADSWSGETIEYCGSCEPFKAVDLNGDGREELIVVLQYFSIMQYGVYTAVQVDSEPRVVPFRTGEPGHPQHALDPGKPFTFWVGGDAGSAEYFYCDTLPEVRLTATDTPIDPGPDDVTTVHETHVSFGADGIANILDANTFTVPADVVIDLQYATSKPDCGLGVDLWAVPS